jgi:hypothetical protein
MTKEKYTEKILNKQSERKKQTYHPLVISFPFASPSFKISYVVPSHPGAACDIFIIATVICNDHKIFTNLERIILRNILNKNTHKIIILVIYIFLGEFL